MKAKRRKCSSAFKAQVAIEALKERETMAGLSKRYEVHSNMISKWKSEFLERSAEIFETAAPGKVSKPYGRNSLPKLNNWRWSVTILKKTSRRGRTMKERMGYI